MATHSLSSRIGKSSAAAFVGLMPSPIHQQRNFPKTGMSLENPPFQIPIEHRAITPDDFSRTKEEVEDSFMELLAEWKQATLLKSDAVALLMHPAHFRIIGLGPQVLPFIFADLGKGGGPWFVALESITHENPVKPEHKVSAKRMRSDWIQWGIEHGYVKT